MYLYASGSRTPRRSLQSQAVGQGSGIFSKFTHGGCWQQISVPHHVALFIGLLTIVELVFPRTGNPRK